MFQVQVIKAVVAFLVGGAIGKALADTKRRVFVSYDHDEDCRYRDLLRAWDKNSKFDFECELASPVVAINSDDAGVIKAALTKKLKNSDYLLVIVGSETHQSTWIDWELTRSMQQDVNLKLAAIRISEDYDLPAAIENKGVASRVGFSLENINAVLEEAKQLH